jgi:hypothetical protein
MMMTTMIAEMTGEKESRKQELKNADTRHDSTGRLIEAFGGIDAREVVPPGRWGTLRDQSLPSYLLFSATNENEGPPSKPAKMAPFRNSTTMQV